MSMFIEPLAGWRVGKVTERHTKVDWAEATRESVDEHYPGAEVIVLVMDNLNSHGLGSLYEAFPPEEVFRIARKLGINYTPKPGSWLNMAESELSILSRQFLNQRLPDQKQLQCEVTAWKKERNQAVTPMIWRFETADAYSRLGMPLPIIQT